MLTFFPLSRVNPLYYVTFTTCTLLASFIMFRGFNTTDAVNTISLICGFLVIFAGVYLLNLSREDPDGKNLVSQGDFEDAPATDGMSALMSRRSMQARRSGENTPISGTFPRGSFGDRERLMRNYDVEDGFGLGDLAEDSDEANAAKEGGYEDANGRRSAPRTPTGAASRLSGSGRTRIEREQVRMSKGEGR